MIMIRIVKNMASLVRPRYSDVSVIRGEIKVEGN